MMRLCCVIPDSRYEKVAAVVKKEFSFIDVDYLVYADYKEAPALIEKKQQNYDAIIFSGKAPFEYSEARLRQETYWCYFSHAGNSLLRALLEAVLRGWDITRLSIDTYEESFLRAVYMELGIRKENMQVRLFTGDRTDEDYNQKVFEFHCRNMKDSMASGCVTGLYGVSKMMNALGVPHIMTSLGFDVISDSLNEVLRFYRAKRDARSQIAVLTLHIEYPSNFPSILESEYNFMLEKTRIAQQIYQYAERIEASVSENSIYDYTLFATKKIIETDTHYYQTLPLLDWLAKTTVYQISIGAGHGETVAQARHNAVNALLKARKHARSAAYALLNDEQYIGPIFALGAESKSAEPESTRYDGRLSAAAKKTGLSVNTIYRLHAFLLERQNELCTSEELAKGLNVSRRSTDRLLEKLENADYARIEGKISSHGYGRPLRIIRIRLL